jgi:hypothetical protein
VQSYLLAWEVAMPVLGLMAVGIATVGAWGEREAAEGAARTPHDLPEVGGRLARVRGWPSLMPKAGLAGVALFVTAALSIDMAGVSPLARASNPPVAAAWHTIAPHIRQSEGSLFLTGAGPASASNAVLLISRFEGVFNELEARGFRPCVAVLPATIIGSRYVCARRAPVSVELFEPSPSVEHMPGYVGHLRWTDIVIVRAAPGTAR